MEEILASIKRVIAEDNRAAATVGAPARPQRIAARAAERRGAEEDVLELDDPVTEGPGLMSDDAAAASRERLASPVGAAPAQRAAGRHRRARGGRPRDAAADAQGLARRASARDRRGARHPRDRPDHRPRPLGSSVCSRAAAVLGRAAHEKAPAREPRPRSLSPRLPPPPPARSPPPISPPCGGSAAPTVSPDGHWAVYQLRETDLDGQSRPHRPVAARSAPRRRRAGPDRLGARA